MQSIVVKRKNGGNLSKDKDTNNYNNNNRKEGL